MLKSQKVRGLAPEMDPLRMGMGWTAQDLEKPQVLIESTYGQSHPGSAHLLELAQAAAGVAGLYFHFQLLTDLAETARMKEYPSVKKLLRLRTVKTLLSTFIMAVGLPPVSQFITGARIYWVLGIGIVVTIWICLTLNDISLYLDKLDDPEEIPPAV